MEQQYAIALLKIRQTINLYDDPDFEIAEIPSFTQAIPLLTWLIRWLLLPTRNQQ
ncbi:hypothetical protein H9W95_15030 [Flavobacterium lindanitolerans]|nr:hypothetical protein [Flavobacterium lindanitolerans]